MEGLFHFHVELSCAYIISCYNLSMKKCQLCKRVLEDQKFYVKRYHNGTIGLRSYCMECSKKARDKWRKRYSHIDNARNKAYNKENAHIIRGNKLTKYWPGTTWHQATENYKNLREKQNGVCAICKKPENRKHMGTGTIWDLAVDHCHETGEVRGLLCNKCNRGLGLLGDKFDTIENVLIYLNRGENE